MNFTPAIRPFLLTRSLSGETSPGEQSARQLRQLARLLSRAASTEMGRRHGFSDLLHSPDIRRAFAEEVPVVGYEEIRGDVMQMVRGERDVLWRGVCRYFAQSSGTSGGKSKYIPVTADSLRANHYPGAAVAVANYLRAVPRSRFFSGKGLILGGSFANEVADLPAGSRVGDLSATLIHDTPGWAEFFRTPSRSIALMADWEEKLPRLAERVARENVTNISGVPSWMLAVLRKVLDVSGKATLSEVWPNLEVFIHGGISFTPYREQYLELTRGLDIHFLETYNASEGFFAVQSDLADPSMQLLLDHGVYYEFIPLSEPGAAPVGIDSLQPGKTYELLITAPNGLWRYRIGDTVTIDCASPLKIRIAGRTKTFINAFGEELMEHNAENAVAAACRECGCALSNYTAGPLFPTSHSRGRHQWLVEWTTPPSDPEMFAAALDRHLQALNSDYQAKRSGGLFLDPPEVVSLPAGTFSAWMKTFGNERLGGQRKVPRLANDRRYIDALLQISKS